MKRTFVRMLALLLLAVLVSGFVLTAAATENTAQDISADTAISGTGYDSFSFLFDKNIKAYRRSSGNASITLENADGIASIYLMFDLEYGEYTITDNTSGNAVTAGTQGFLHEYINLTEALGTAPTSVTLAFSNGTVRLSEIYVFSDGTAPDYVQQWEAPLEGGADLLLLATHGDDDQLFFAGLLPYYAGELDYRVQVAYLTDHRNLTYTRTHEMLNGLWAMGVEAYPVFGSFDDFRIDSLEGTYNEYAALSTSKDALLEFVVEQLRRFRPLAVVGHDINGEYGHGMHMVYTDLLMQAVEITNDPDAYPGLAQKYGLWDVPKTYLHLYEENPIVIDYDTPLEAFDGLTAFQATQKYGYPCHESQQYTWFTRWINGTNGEITKASQITTYNPCNFGLYRSTVGEDVQKNDFMENLTSYAEQERLEAERIEQERLEQERLEAERQAQEEAERLAQERLEAERLEAERIEQARLAAEQASRQKQLTMALILLGILVVLLIILVCLMYANRRRRRRRK